MFPAPSQELVVALFGVSKVSHISISFLTRNIPFANACRESRFRDVDSDALIDGPIHSFVLLNSDQFSIVFPFILHRLIFR
jgi:hypothetical protein